MKTLFVKSMLAAAAVAGAMSVSAVASAHTSRPVVFVHGRNSGPANIQDYWHNGGYSDNGINAFIGVTAGSSTADTAYPYAYDASQAWDSTASGSPICALTQQMNDAPGYDIAILTHSAGGVVAAYMLTAAQRGDFTSCNISPANARSWTTYVVAIASPYRGSELADAVYGQSGGNFLQKLCGTVAGSLANLLFNQASAMTNGLRTGYMQSSNAYAEITGYSFSGISENWGTYAGGDDATAMQGAAWCAGMPSSNDGVVAAYSASYQMPGAVLRYHDNVGHSSNRRDDYGYYAEWIWNQNPY
jgi:hypothetical protein